LRILSGKRLPSQVADNCDNLRMADEAPHERRPRTPLPRGDDNQPKSFWRTVGGRFWVLVLVLLATAVLVTVAMFETLYYVMG
jgi:hypothetical protein